MNNKYVPRTELQLTNWRTVRQYPIARKSRTVFKSSCLNVILRRYGTLSCCGVLFIKNQKKNQLLILNRWRYFIYHVLYFTLNSTDAPYHLRKISIKCLVRWLLCFSSTHVLHKRNVLTSFDNSFAPRLFYKSPRSLSIKKISLLWLKPISLFYAFIPLYIVEII